MNTRRRILGLIVTLAAGLTGCSEPQTPAGKPVIVTTIVPLASLVQQMVGDTAEVVTLVPPGVSPHGFEPTVQQMQALSRASALVMIGAGYDEWAQRAARQQRRKIPVIRFDEAVGIEVEHHDHDHGSHAGHDHGPVNPHLWVDPVLTKLFIETLGREKLPPLMPAAAAVLEANTDRLSAELAQLDAEIGSALAPHAGKPLVTYHNAFDPMAERYGLKVALTLVPDDSIGATLTPARLDKARQIIREHQLKAVYSEPQFPADFAEPLKAMGVAVYVLDPLGDPASDDRATYQQMMRYNLGQILRGF